MTVKRAIVIYRESELPLAAPDYGVTLVHMTIKRGILTHPEGEVREPTPRRPNRRGPRPSPGWV